MQKMWEGRFKEKSSYLLEEFNASIQFDQILYEEDIKGSIAHATMLAQCSILTKQESDQIIQGLKTILNEIKQNKFEFKIEDEDIHMCIEKRLGELIGTHLSGKLHTARSRNDQVAVDFKQFVMKQNIEIANLLIKTVEVLKNIAKQNLNTLMPGFTHLQHAQPISLAYHMMAYVFMFQRDIKRFLSSFERNNYSPLGSAALAGTPHPIDRNLTAKLLGFKAPSSNAMDCVSDRDFALEILFNISLVFTHTSRLCEELILWSSQEFNFITISDAYSTGSSIMPQKKNPDVAELIRGKTGRIYGNLISLLTVMKSLPLAYNKDMQEDKEGVFDSVNQIHTSLLILNEMLKTAKFNENNMLNACKKGHLTATDLADYLVKYKSIPFREAHFITGKCVALAESKGIDLSDMNINDLKNIDNRIDKNAALVLDLNKSKEARNSQGGTSNESVRLQIKEIEDWLKNIKFDFNTNYSKQLDI